VPCSCALAAGDSKGATPPHVYDVLKPVLLEKEKAEDRLKVCWALRHSPCRCSLPCSLPKAGCWVSNVAPSAVQPVPNFASSAVLLGGHCRRWAISSRLSLCGQEA